MPALLAADKPGGEIHARWCRYMVIPPRVTLNETTKKFPVLMYVYGGPGSQTVTKQFFAAGSRSKWHMFLASRGYIVVSVDNRGTGARCAPPSPLHHSGAVMVPDGGVTPWRCCVCE